MRRVKTLLALTLLATFVLPTIAHAQWVWTPETGRFVNIGNLPKETPELQIEFARSLMLEERYSNALDETEKFDKFYGDTDVADENQFLRGEIKLRQEEYRDAAQEFQDIIVNYPNSELYDDVIRQQYAVGDQLFARGESRLKERKEAHWWRPLKRWSPYRKRPFRHAIDVYSMVIDNQPFTAQAAEAQYKVGLSHYTLEEYEEAAFEYRTVTEDYRGTDWVPDASYGLARCYEKGSHPPAYDQVPSELAIGAVDEFGFNYPADVRNTELKLVRGEMREKIANQRLLIARFYERRDLDRSSRVYYEVLVNEFAETGAAEKAREWLDAHPPRDRAINRFIGPAYLN